MTGMESFEQYFTSNNWREHQVSIISNSFNVVSNHLARGTIARLAQVSRIEINDKGWQAKHQCNVNAKSSIADHLAIIARILSTAIVFQRMINYVSI
jgi:hypothetical protein